MRESVADADGGTSRTPTVASEAGDALRLLPQPSEADLRECADEPIRVPGMIQPGGVLLAVGPDGRVRRASENLSSLIPFTAEQALGRQLQELLKLKDDPLASEPDSPMPMNRQPTLLRVETEEGEWLTASVHRVDGETVLELETEPPRGGADAGGRNGRDATRLLLGFRQIAHEASDVRVFCDRVATHVARHLGYDRVMIYRFDCEWNGEVLAEAVADGVESFLGLNYPAADIPAQARQLYLENRVRQIGDVAADPVPVRDASEGPPLDMACCALRSLSPIHCVYLRNMGVAATLTLSIVVGGRLWGLVACHHRSPRRLSLADLQNCGLFGDLLSAEVQTIETARRAEALEERHRFHADVFRRIQSAEMLVPELADVSESLMRIVDADAMAMRFGDEIHTFGDVPAMPKLERLFQAIAARTLGEICFIDCVSDELPECEVDDERAGGMAAAEFWPQDYILFLRRSRTHTVRWGGHPAKGFERDPRGRLLPRSSFAEWVQAVEGRSRPWTATDRQAATDFRNALAVFIIRRSRDLATLNQQLVQKSREIEQFVYSISHDLKSPLVTCRGFLGLIREDLAVGDMEEVRDSLRRAESATETMNAFIGDLLEFSRIGSVDAGPVSQIDLADVLAEAQEDLFGRLKECEATIDVRGELPVVRGRRTTLLRIFENLFDNALKYACDCPGGRIAVSCRTGHLDHVVSVRDWGPGIPEELHEKAMRLFQRVHAKKTGTGIGLASVAKSMEQLGGSARLANPEDGGLAVELVFPRHTGDEE